MVFSGMKSLPSSAEPSENQIMEGFIEDLGGISCLSTIAMPYLNSPPPCYNKTIVRPFLAFKELQFQLRLLTFSDKTSGQNASGSITGVERKKKNRRSQEERFSLVPLL